MAGVTGVERIDKLIHAGARLVPRRPAKSAVESWVASAKALPKILRR